jgi:hypothetical protein
MYRVLKFLHILGLTLFLGSIFGHIVASVLGGEPGTASFLFARQDVTTATRALTAPGLALTILTGIAMVIASQQSPFRVRWLAVHGGLAVVVAILAATVIIPAGQEILNGAIALRDAAASVSVEQIAAAKRIEDTVGGINLLLALIAAFIGVWKPKL